MTPKSYKREREKRGTQAHVASLLEVSRVAIARRETGARPISREAWLALLSIEDSCECVSTNRPDVDSCPFCGSIPHVYKSRKVYKVECPCINNRVTRYKNAAFDPIKWNSRPIEDKLRARIKELEDEL